MSQRNPHMNWIDGYTKRYAGHRPNTYVAEYALKDLMNKDLINVADGQDFLELGGLRDFHWSITWYEDFETPDEMLVDRLADVHGYVMFVHGWTGNMYIWEDLPDLVVDGNHQLVAIAIDHNGFGKSLFEDETPPLDTCNPPAAMNTLQRFVDLINIRRQRGGTKLKVINFVGHSMGGATLFYLMPMQWSYGEFTRFALAPALLLEDESHRAFYTALGLGIDILHFLGHLGIVVGALTILSAHWTPLNQAHEESTSK